MSPAEMLFVLMRAADKHAAERRYFEAARSLELAALAAREAAQAARRHQRTVIMQAVPRLTVVQGGARADAK